MKINKVFKASKIKGGKSKKNRRTFVDLSPSIISNPSSLYNSFSKIENYNEHLKKKNPNPKTLCGVPLESCPFCLQGMQVFIGVKAWGWMDEDRKAGAPSDSNKMPRKRRICRIFAHYLGRRARIWGSVVRWFILYLFIFLDFEYLLWIWWYSFLSSAALIGSSTIYFFLEIWWYYLIWYISFSDKMLLEPLNLNRSPFF